MLSGSLGVPITAVVFLELAHFLPALLALLPASIASYPITALIMPGSILTETLSRRASKPDELAALPALPERTSPSASAQVATAPNSGPPPAGAKPHGMALLTT
jgi:hypothetical protein